MRNHTMLALAVASFSLAAAPAFAVAASDPAVVPALDAIQKQADDVAEGRVHGKKAMRAAADVIAVEWDKAEPIVVANPNVIVETKIANAAIRAYEREWKDDAKAKADAKDVSTAIVSLRTDLTPPSPSPAPVDSGGAPAASPAGAASPAASP